MYAANVHVFFVENVILEMNTPQGDELESLWIKKMKQ